jgi:hypothetical protein
MRESLCTLSEVSADRDVLNGCAGARIALPDGGLR